MVSQNISQIFNQFLIMKFKEDSSKHHMAVPNNYKVWFLG